MEIKNIAVKISVLVVFFSLIVLSGISAWTEPIANPPGGTIYPPINTGADNQVKDGNLHLNAGGINTFALTVSGDIAPSPTTDTYDLGTPSLRFNNGYFKNIYFDKGTFGELDPIYQINDKKYSTYVSDTIGLKAEVIGESEFNGDSLIIDLDDQKEGSDLWLFNNIVKKGIIIPFVSSQSPVAIYGYIKDSQFIIKTIGDYVGNVKFSYRLIGERIDNTAENNLADDQNISTYINVDELR